MNRRLEPLTQQVRARLGKHLLLDTTHAQLFFEDEHHPWRAIPRDALRVPLTGPPVADPVDGHWWTIELGGTRRTHAVRAWDRPPPDCPELTGVLVIHHDAADQWLEEEQPVPGMPKNPYHRVDVLPASRHIEIRVHGELLATTRRPTLVVETGLPPRWYIPPGDIHWDRLTPNPRRTVCQYKGTAHYWTIDHTHPPLLVWSYPEPLPETAALAGLVSILDDDPGVDLRELAG
ncbi:DUF427 domain-containing protein [Actinophytocola sp.]|uniref:DUF427 domain-containing protein n=1 Tax=Actinophytocola sp. TaxID=1872138 RepID=UPI002D7ECFA8|nr:DUF427 domain-containing protein [Actinophytocola sp.]HET9143419.1 DUF427 domain-containing protein [Actinophytocola sp.]